MVQTRRESVTEQLGLRARHLSSLRAKVPLTRKKASSSSGSWLPKALWLEQKAETEVWLP